MIKAMADNKNLYDVVVIGGGPAGLTAALYLARARCRVIVVEKDRFGGQITITDEVVNYPGVESISGAALTESMRKQAESFGAEFMLADVESIEPNGDIKTVKTGRGELKCFGILAAVGAHPRTVGFKGELENRGRGVAYCATCDGEFFTGKEVFVVGGGYAAAEESVFLTRYAKHVTVLVRKDAFKCAPLMAEAVLNNDKITVLFNTTVDEVVGDGALRSIKYTNSKTGEAGEYKAEEGDTFGVFVFAGYEPATELLKGIVELDESGYVVTDRSQKTSVEGIYAAGDVCIKPLRQVVTAVGDGALAATELERYAVKMQKKTGLHPEQPKVDVNGGLANSGSSGSSDNGGSANRGSINGGSSIGNRNSVGVSGNTSGNADASGLFTPDMLNQLNAVFSRMENLLVLELYTDDSELSKELQHYMEELTSLTDKLSLTKGSGEAEYLPCVKICKADGTWSGLAFHGTPGGHEFTSFILGLYNASGPGQPLDEDIKEAIAELDKNIDMKILVSLSCTMCPELVTAAQHIAAKNDRVTAQVYDVSHFQELKDKYKVMSVPCLVINDGETVSFGRKNIKQLLEILQ